METKYWEEYYKNISSLDQPSDFAKFCTSYENIKINEVFDVGCGNARDTIHFANQNIISYGIDQSEVVINKNLQNTIKVRNYVNFFKADFTNFEYDNYTAKNYSIYSRFTLHAINYKEEEVFLQNIFNIRKLDYVLIEARTIRDNLYGNGTNVGLHEYVTSHYRRFIDPEILIKKLEKYFKIIYAEENIGFSIIKNDNPTLIRLICKRI